MRWTSGAPTTPQRRRRWAVIEEMPVLYLRIDSSRRQNWRLKQLGRLIGGQREGEEPPRCFPPLAIETGAPLDTSSWIPAGLIGSRQPALQLLANIGQNQRAVGRHFGHRNCGDKLMLAGRIKAPVIRGRSNFVEIQLRWRCGGSDFFYPKASPRDGLRECPPAVVRAGPVARDWAPAKYFRHGLRPPRSLSADAPCLKRS